MACKALYSNQPVSNNRLQFPDIQCFELSTSTACKESNTKAVCFRWIDPATHTQSVVCEHFDHGVVNEDMQQQWFIGSKRKRPFSYVSLHILTHARLLAINEQASLQAIIANESLLCTIRRTPHPDAQFRCLAWD